MKPLGPERDHYWLALAMSRTAGARVETAIAEGRFDQAGWAEAVHRCRGCAWAADCPSWLAAQEAEVARAPETCVNADLFARLRAGLAPDGA